MDAIRETVSSIPSAVPFAIDLVIRATILLAIIQLSAVALRRASAATRHFVLSLGMVALVILPFLMLALPDARLAVLPANSAVAQSPAVEGALPSELAWKTGSESIATPGATVVDVVATAAKYADGDAGRIATIVAWLATNWSLLLLVGLALIPITLLGRLAIGIAAVGSIARRSEPVTDRAMVRELERAQERLAVTREATLLVSDEISVPIVWGVSRIVLILPIEALEWTRERLRVVLLHEMAHVRRGDVISVFVGRIATALYWFHPLSWLVERDARRECERACDDLVLEHGARPSEYAHHLLGIAAGEDLAEGYASVSLAMARPTELEGRLIAILRAGSERKSVSRRFALVASALLGLALLPIATVRLAARPVPADQAKVTQVQRAVEHRVTARQTATASEYRFAEKSGEQALRSDAVDLIGHKRHRDSDSPAGEKWYDSGMENHNRDRYEEARADFEKAIAEGFKTGASMYNIACGYAIQGDVANAVHWLDEAITNGFDDVEHLEGDSDLDPIRNDPQFRGLIRDLRAKQGYRGEGGDRVDDARERVVDLRSARSDDASEWADAAVDLLRLRDLDLSIEAFGEAIRLSPESSTARYNLACAYAIKGDRARSLDSLEGAILNGFDNRDKLENDPDLRSIRGDARFAQMKKLNEQLSLWNDDSKRRDWDDKDAFRAAMPRFDEAVRLYPQAGRAWFNLGFAALRSGDFAKAREGFGRSLTLGYRRGTTMYNLACTEAVAGNKDAAFDWLRKAEESGFELGGMNNDDDLDSLRDDPRFDGFLERAWRSEGRDKWKHEKTKEKNAEYEYRASGSWDVL